MVDFGPEYSKIQTLWKRDYKGIIIPGEYTLPEFEYLSQNSWRWTEKVDGTNIRLHWALGQYDVPANITIGGRTKDAQIPTFLIEALQPWTDVNLWAEVFFDTKAPVTLYGEGYGAKIQKGGGNYRPDQGFILFDVCVGDWWLKQEDVVDIGKKMGMDVVPEYFCTGITEAWHILLKGELKSHWANVEIEGLVGRPVVDLRTRRGDRIITKMKVKDWTQYCKAKEKEIHG